MKKLFAITLCLIAVVSFAFQKSTDIHGADGDYVAKIAGSTNKSIDAEDVVNAKIHNVVKLIMTLAIHFLMGMFSHNKVNG